MEKNAASETRTHNLCRRAAALGDRRPPISSRAWDVLNILRVIGPGAILLGTAIGGGEWLLGPTIDVNYGLKMLWVTTVAVVLQTLLNLELIRYTMYTGEPIITGLMRTKPGSTFWGCTYSLLKWFQCGWPALPGTAAGTLAAGFLGRLPNQQQDGMLVFGSACWSFSLAQPCWFLAGR